MKKLATGLLLCMAVVTASAQTMPENVFFAGDKIPAMKAHQPYGFSMFPKQKKVIAKEEAATGQLVVTVDFADGKYSSYYLMVYGQDYEHTEFMWTGTSEVTLDLPEGNYTLLIPYTNRSDAGKPGQALVIKENVGVYEGETTSLTMSPTMATERISFSFVLADGSAPVLPSTTEEGYYYDEYDYTNANVDEVACYGLYGCDEYGPLYGFSGNLLASIDGAVKDAKNYFDVAVSPVGDNWHFTQTRYMHTIDGGNNYYFMHSSVNGLKSAPEVNSTEFVEWKPTFATNPCYELYGGEETWGYKVQNLVNGMVDTMAFVTYIPGEMPHLFMSEPKNNDTELWGSTYAVALERVEYNQMIESEWGDYEDFRSIATPYVVYDKDTKSPVITECGSCLYGSPLWWTENSDDPNTYPGNTVFGTPANDTAVAFGESAPLCESLLTYYGDDEEGLTFNMEPIYTGIYGEGRSADGAMSTAYVTVGDDENMCNMDDLNDTLEELCAEGKLTGAFEIELINDLNVKTAGIQGYNRTVVSIANGSASDFVAPTTTMLQFRNADGTVTNQFDKAADGEIAISGGDFVLKDDKWYDVEPADLTVEYAPVDSEEYKEIEMTEVPDNFYMPNFGYYWHGSLAKVEGLTDYGWYKLRITLTDAAGNSQKQTIYPAFKVAENSGVSKIYDNDNTKPVEYYNLQGIRVENPSAGSIVIRRQGNSASKVVF